MPEVIKADHDLFKKMQETYATPTSKLAPGAVFHAKMPGVTVTGYRTGKVLFQGKLASEEAARWGKAGSSTTPATKQPAQKGSLPNGFSSWSVLGSDEVGTGSYFGPLTTAAVFVDQSQVAELQGWGVQDSKKLTDPTIIRLAKKIIKSCPYHVVNLDPQDYNRLIKKYNQAQLKALCHNLVLGKVEGKIQPQKPQAVLIDQFVSASTYYRYLSGQPTIIKQNVYFREKGESYHVAVAAASIVARYYSLLSMDRLSQKAGITLPIGAGQQVDQVAVKLVKKGLDLGEFAKLHFANTKKIKSMLNH
ncbi:ribonuclease HIII [Limosilactobacillus secaliphilus]|uniref:Ribonuclease HIII n=1 Tax=Limosilactobacillus secaliphilus TaxID=396268 RepID=A0A0R2I2I4_9LACO|nr:ribonuclease HIII [Limosilactobacillus secaliphilus]KRN59392.1 ribonuclease HIII [Limosilactobacillus secaliphilus]